MTLDLGPILRVLDRLRARERRLGAWAWGAGLLSLVLLCWTGAMGLAARGSDRQSAAALVGAALALGALGLGTWAALGWRASRDPVRQARRVEALEPRLRGRLFTLLERQEGPRGQESAEILGLTLHRAQPLVEAVDPRAVLPWGVLRAPLGVLLSSALLWVALGVLAPMGPLATLRWLGGRSVALPAPAAAALPEAGRVVLGDMVLRYEYPEYTGLPPLEVPNSNGAAHGPPGTRVTVRARAARTVDSAALQAYEAEPVQAELSGGRDLSGAFGIGPEEGVYRFLLQRGAERELSADFPITPEPDLPPVVEVEAAADRLEVALDQDIPLTWQARDDYGVARVGVRVDRTPERALREPLTPLTSLGGALGLSPRKLDLSPGDEVVLHITAWDNDAVSGAKMGESRPIRVVVLGPQAQARRFLRLRKELRDALIDVLAPFAVDPSPLAADRKALASWAGRAAGRFEPIDAMVEKYWDGFDDRSLEGRIVEELRRQGGALLRFAQEAGDARSTEPLAEADGATLADLHDELVGSLEINILMLDRMVQYQALGELYAQAQRLESEAQTLRARAEAGAAAEELLTRLDRIDELMARMQASAKDYDGALSELVEVWTADMQRASARARQTAAAGDDARTRELAVALAEQAARFSATLKSRQQQMEESSEEQQEAIRKFIEELQRLETEERALQEATRQAREAAGGGDARLIEQWILAERLASSVLDLVRKAETQLQSEADTRSAAELARAERTVRQAERTLRAIEARDLATSVQETQRVALSTQDLRETVEWMDRRDPERPALPEAQDALARAELKSVQLYELLTQLDESANRSTPQLAAQTRGMAGTQSTLREDVSAQLPFARELAGELPMGAPGLVEGLEGAEREMDRARAALERARAVEAEGAEEAAADRIAQALEALSRSAAAMQAMEDAMEGGGGRGDQEGGAGGQEGEERAPPDGRIELPDPEEFRTPEEYRKALLEGMQGEVPEEYEALKRRYYEELVRQ